MGFFNKTAEEKEEKILKDEQRADDKAVKQALKDVERANKAELKAAKEEHNTIEDHQKSIRRIERLTDELNKLQHEMEAAVSARDTLERQVAAKREEHSRLHEETIVAKQKLDSIQNKVNTATQVRHERLGQLAAPVTGSPGSASNVAAGAAAGAALGSAGASPAGSNAALSGNGTPPPLPGRSDTMSSGSYGTPSRNTTAGSMAPMATTPPPAVPQAPGQVGQFAQPAQTQAMYAEQQGIPQSEVPMHAPAPVAAGAPQLAPMAQSAPFQPTPPVQEPINVGAAAFAGNPTAIPTTAGIAQPAYENPAAAQFVENQAQVAPPRHPEAVQHNAAAGLS